MLRREISLATVATMTNAKHCKFLRGVTRCNSFSQLAMRTPKMINSLPPAAILKSPASKRLALIGSFSQNCVAGCDGHVTRSNLSRNVAES